MVWYCYEIVNKLNGKYYRGKSGSENPETDNYFGSGTIIRKAIKQDGRENFEKRVLATFDSESEAYTYEAKIITLTEVNDPNCYNIQLGGLGGTQGAVYMCKDGRGTRVCSSLVQEYESNGWNRGIPEEIKKKHSASLLGKTHRGCVHTEEWKIQHSVQLKGRPNLKNRVKKSKEFCEQRRIARLGKKFGPRSEETKQKIRETLHQRNLENPRIRVTNEIQEKLVYVGELNGYLDLGWRRGGKVKKLDKHTR